ncbi:hypothetical protein Hanom_Chr08g00725401 [Helianthus anomalus]
MFELGESAFDSSRKEFYGERRAAAATNEKVDHFELHKVDCSANYAAKRQEYEFLEFPFLELLKNYLGKELVWKPLRRHLKIRIRRLMVLVSRMNGSYDKLLCLVHLALCFIVLSSSGLDNVCFIIMPIFCSRLKCTKGIANRLLCFIDPTVHLVMTSLGGLQCLFYLVYDVFVYLWVRSDSWLTGFYYV